MRIFTRMSVASMITLVAAVAFLSSTISSTSAGNWPQWRGPDGQGVSTEKNLPTEWSATKTLNGKRLSPDARTHRQSFGVARYSSRLQLKARSCLEQKLSNI
ncbi:MAG: hypothetical protein ACR2IB_08030 [Pyrinomonadaceae bacterium]